MFDYKNIVSELLLSKKSLSEIKELSMSAIAFLTALSYVIGFLSFTFLDLSYNIDNLELLKAKYILAGVYYLIFYFILLILPNTIINSIYKKLFYYLVVSLIIYLLNENHQNYTFFLFEHIISGSSKAYSFESFFQFRFVFEFFSILFLISICAILFIAGKKKFLDTSGKRSPFFVILSIPLSLIIFINYLLVEIPKSIGGGEAPVVRIEFTPDTPHSLTLHFDLSKYTNGGYQFYAKLLHQNSDKIYLTPVPWYSHSVFEIDNKNILFIEYSDYNPAPMGYKKYSN